MRFFIMIFAIVLSPIYIMGQNYSPSSEKPFWAKGFFSEVENSYIEVVSAFDYDLATAKDKAAKEVIKRRSLATGSEANVTIEGKDIQVISNHDVIVKARVIDEYVEHTLNGYTVFQLVQTAKNPTFSYEPITISNEYEFSARAFVPGMAQIYKGSKAKGSCIIAAEALSVASIIVCENQRAAYHKKAIENPKHAKEYSDNASNWESGRNISIGIAAGVWIYNIIDGIVAKGKKRLIVGQPGDKGLSMMPYVSSNATGVSMAYHF